jgi:hypothetical protein
MLWTRERKLSSTISARVASIDATWWRNSFEDELGGRRCG